MLVTHLIDTGSLAKLLAARPVVLDCRFDLNAPEAGREAYLAAHIPGALYVDLNRDLAAPVTADSGRHPLPTPRALADRFASLGITRDTQVVVYDDANGSFAARAWWLLRWLGHTRVAVLDGGFKAWLAGGGAQESGAPRGPAPEIPVVTPATATPATTEPPVETRSLATSADIHRALQDPAARVVDARAAERYAGRVEPIDPVAGHVPGALNHPFTANLTPEGRFLPADELRRRWQQRLAGARPEDTILMCGSGVTACHNLLALEIAGLTGARLYAGSWSEWIRNPQNPVARGDSPS